jgi:amino acid permease
MGEQAMVGTLSGIITLALVMGFFGGALSVFLNVAEQLQRKREERNFTERIYWKVNCVWPFVGALLVFALDDQTSHLSKIVSLQKAYAFASGEINIL